MARTTEELARRAFERWGMESRRRAKIDSMVGPGWDELSHRERAAWVATVEWIKAEVVAGETETVAPGYEGAAELIARAVVLYTKAAIMLASAAPANTDHAEATVNTCDDRPPYPGCADWTPGDRSDW